MESNVLCSLLVLLFTVPREKTAVLCTLDYTDHTRCLPTRVHLESEGKSFTFIFVLNANSVPFPQAYDATCFYEHLWK